jgi:hypothetical protein
MNKIIFAAALLAVLTLTIAIGVTTLQTAKAQIETEQSCMHKLSVRCGTHDIGKSIQDGVFGLIDGLTENSNK